MQKDALPISASFRWKLLAILAIAFVTPIVLGLMDAPDKLVLLAGFALLAFCYWYIASRVLGAYNRLRDAAQWVNSDPNLGKDTFSKDQLTDLVHTFDPLFSHLEDSYTEPPPVLEGGDEADPGETVLLRAVRGHAVFKAGLSTGDTAVGESTILPRRVDEDFVLSSRLVGANAKNIFLETVSSVDKQLLSLMEAPELSDEDKGIIGFQSMLLEDEALINGVQKCLTDGLSLPESLSTTFAVITSKLESSKNSYIAARAADCHDLRQRLLDTIVKKMNPAADDFYTKAKGKIVLCQQVYPSEVIMLHRAGVIGIVSVQGTPSSHAEILMQSFNIASLSNIEALSVHMLRGRRILLDTAGKRLVVDPTDVEVEEATKLADIDRQDVITGPVTLASGEEIRVTATINNVEVESERAVASGADGVGLFRSEMTFIGRADLPEEDELYEEYRKLTDAFAGMPVTMRMLDLGSDKVSVIQNEEREENPCMGNRSMRLLIKRPGIFRRQLRAMLRAAHSDTCILFPMISGWHELEKIRTAIERMTDEFVRDGGSVPTNIKFGLMVEVPSIVQRFEDYVADFDVFNIGTNDLTQYSLAADRNNEYVAEYFKTYHPSVLSMINRVCHLGQEAGKKVCLCGEMATNLRLLPLLIGLGVRDLSIPCIHIPRVKKLVKTLRLKDCDRLAEEVLVCRSTDDVEDVLADYRDAVAESD